MTISIGATFSTDKLTAQPLAYEGEARTGLTARTFRLSGLLTTTQWQALLAEYNAWRDTRIQDVDTLKSGVVGTTISLTISGVNGINVTSLACWFCEPPAGTQAGAYISATCDLVDAAQALEVLKRTEEKSRQRRELVLPNLGTITLGSCVITLTKPMDTRRDGPVVALTAAGRSYITGPLAAHKVRQIEGFITTGTLDDLLAWYDTTIASVPSATSWFPVSEPSATAEVIIDLGAKYTRYTAQITVLQIR